MSGIEELYAIVNQVAKEQEAIQSTSKNQPPPEENGRPIALLDNPFGYGTAQYCPYHNVSLLQVQ